MPVPLKLSLAISLVLSCAEERQQPAPVIPDSGMESPHTSDAGASADSGFVFEACATYTGTDGGGAECAQIEVPLHWAEPSSEHISLFVKRVDRVSAFRASEL